MYVRIVGFQDVEEAVSADVCLDCRIFNSFFVLWLMRPILSRFLSMAFSSMDLEPTMKFNCCDVHPEILVFLRMSMKFPYCLLALSSVFSR